MIGTTGIIYRKNNENCKSVLQRLTFIKINLHFDKIINFDIFKQLGISLAAFYLHFSIY